MAEVPDHLAPRAGLTNATIRFAGLEANGSSVNMRFEMFHPNKVSIGEIVVPVNPLCSADKMIVVAHQEAINVLRQWLHVLELSRKGYDTQSKL